jgi:hypothetical protein
MNMMLGKKKKKKKVKKNGHKSKKTRFHLHQAFFSEVFCAILQGLK